MISSFLNLCVKITYICLIQFKCNIRFYSTLSLCYLFCKVMHFNVNLTVTGLSICAFIEISNCLSPMYCNDMQSLHDSVSSMLSVCIIMVNKKPFRYFLSSFGWQLQVILLCRYRELEEKLDYLQKSSAQRDRTEALLKQKDKDCAQVSRGSVVWLLYF